MTTKVMIGNPCANKFQSYEWCMLMTEESLDLFCEHPDCVDADEFALDMEALAAKYEVTVDYLIEEFIL
jgi:hypothetical protein